MRTQSLHVVVIRLWRIVLGRMAVADPEIGEFITKRSDLMAFRHVSGIPARTHGQSKRLIRWAEGHDEDLSTIRRCGNLFDLETCQLRDKDIPPGWIQPLIFLFFSAMVMSLMVAGFGMATTKGMYQFRGSGTWFLLSKDSAVALSPLKQGRIVAEMCVDRPSPEAMPPFSIEETNILCQAFDTSEVENKIKKTLAEQRILFGILSGVLAWLAWTSFTCFRRNDAAKCMAQRLKKTVASSVSQNTPPVPGSGSFGHLSPEGAAESDTPQ